jgi:hypothetical protein
MSDRVITLSVSEQAYARAQEIAARTAQPIESVLRGWVEAAGSMPSLAPDDAAELKAMQALSDDALWTIASEQMPRPEQERLSLLLKLNERDAATPQEIEELDQLLERGNRLMLRKAEAAAILTERGYTVRPENLAKRHE